MPARAYVAWWAAYDAGGLAAGQSPPDALRAEVAGAKTLVSSPLRRSLETAQALARGRPILIEPLLVEARLPPPPLPDFLKLRPPNWGVVSRLSWWLGHSGGQESRTAAEARAAQAAKRLIKLSDHGPLVAFGHGWFNRMLRPHLRNQGWRCVTDGRDGYWRFRRYEGPIGPFAS